MSNMFQRGRHRCKSSKSLAQRDNLQNNTEPGELPSFTFECNVNTM